MKSLELSNGKSRPASAPTVPIPTAELLAQARAARWRQNGEPVLTADAARTWLNRAGLVLYRERSQQLPAPAPNYLEASLGRPAGEPNAKTDAAESVAARRLLARLISEGAAVPLNLLGVTGATGTDTPDFLASPAVFSYIFTLRGNKAWKQPPATAGAVRVSPLGLAVYEMLSAKVTLSAYDLATQLGKEVTEAAVLRALTELWSQLRVLPVPQAEGEPTLWELSTARFTKQIKAGANAGQPSALSALISLYLGEAVAATEEEIETFLSPLAPRSRLREVTHALLAARQLETLVIDGKTLLHVAGELPEFTAPAAAEEPEESGGEADDGAEEVSGEPAAEDAGEGSRIRKLTPTAAGKLSSGLKARPAFGAKAGGRSGPRAGSAGARPSRPGGGKPSFGRPPFGKPAGDRERRPFSGRPSAGGRRPQNQRPENQFDKPWDEARPVRTPAAEGIEASGAERPARPRPSTGFSGSERPARKTFSKPGTFTRKREGFGAGAPRPDRGGEGRPPRREFSPRPQGAARPPRPRPEGGGFAPRSDRAPRPGGFGAGRPDRPATGGPRRPGSFTPRPEGSDFAPRKPFAPRAGGDRPERSGPPAGSVTGVPPPKVFRKFDAPRGPKPFGAKPFGARSAGASERGSERGASRGPDRGPSRGPAGTSDRRPSSFADRVPRPGGGEGRTAGPGGKKPFSKPSAFAGKGGPFAKFADGKKPFRKPGPGAKPPAKRSGGSGGFASVKRRRPEEGDQA